MEHVPNFFEVEDEDALKQNHVCWRDYSFRFQVSVTINTNAIS